MNRTLVLGFGDRCTATVLTPYPSLFLAGDEAIRPRLCAQANGSVMRGSTCEGLACSARPRGLTCLSVFSQPSALLTS